MEYIVVVKESRNQWPAFRCNEADIHARPCILGAGWGGGLCGIDEMGGFSHNVFSSYYTMTACVGGY